MTRDRDVLLRQPEREQVCEACGHAADDLVEHEGGFWCPTVQRCDYNQNIGWINADIQAGIDAEMERMRHGD